MELSKANKELLINEIQVIREKMQQGKDVREKAFFYSAVYGVLERIYNIEYNPQLQFMHVVTNVSHNQIVMRMNQISSGDTAVPFPDNFFEDLDKLLGKMEDKIARNEDTYTILEKISNLAYLLVGNGYYLSQKGVKVFSP